LLGWKFIDLLKFQITNPKKQTNNNTRRKRLRCAWPKFKIPNKKTIALNRFGIGDLPFDYAQGGEHVEPFVIWCLRFGIYL
jgi:hypothetical protein